MSWFLSGRGIALGKTAETLRGLGGALGCNCPSDPRRVTAPAEGEERVMCVSRSQAQVGAVDSKTT